MGEARMERSRNIEDLKDALLSTDRIAAVEVVERIGATPDALVEVEAVVTETLRQIGEDWEKGLLSLAQVYMSGVICEEMLVERVRTGVVPFRRFPRMAIAVLLDHHSLGKNMVLSVLRAAGFSIIDFGSGLSVETLVQRVIEEEIEVLLISSLMYPTALRVLRVREQLDAAGRHPFLIVGGAPFRFDRDLWRRVGADADGGNATDIVGVLEAAVGGAYGE